MVRLIVGAVRYKIHMLVLAAQDAFFLARRPRKDSPHTTAAYQRDLAGVTTLLAECRHSPGSADRRGPDGANLREAFGVFADTHAKSSVLRAWSTWNQFLTFCVAEDFMAGNPMGAVARPKTHPLVPKPLRGEDTPEQLLDGRRGRCAQGPGSVAGAGCAGHRAGSGRGAEERGDAHADAGVDGGAARVIAGCM